MNAIQEISGWPGYAVTEDGQVVSFWQRVKQSRGLFRAGVRSIVGDDGRVMPTFDRKDRKGNPTGYRSVCLSRNGTRKNFYVHELVLVSFVGPRPGAAHEALHGNADRGDNRLTNLRWGTVQENADDREKHGHVHRGASWYRARGLPPREETIDPDLTASPRSGVFESSVDGDTNDHLFSDLLDVG